MSWMPSNDPILGERRSCEALELVIVPRARDLGGFAVRRALPHGKRQMVGPFIFFDAMGPVVFPIGQGMESRLHPKVEIVGGRWVEGKNSGLNSPPMSPAPRDRRALRQRASQAPSSARPA